MKQATKIIIRALIAACLAETAMSASANDAKAWMRPENLRWACYQWENKVHFRRMGGPHVPFWCNSTFLDDYFERLYCKETLQKFKDIGVTCIATSFYKGYGLEAEKEEMARQAGVVRMAHEVGLKVLGYINSDACYYEMLFKELPDAKKMLQRDFNGNWRRPGISYYPHKAKLCVGWPGYLEWMKKVITRAFELGYDGIHFDMAQQGTCFCEACTRQFREYLEKNIPDKTRLGFTGFEHVEIPYVLSVSAWDKKLGHVERTVDPMAQEWIKFNAERFHRVRKEMYDFVKRFGEDKCVVINNPCYDVAGGGDPLRYRDAGDCFYIESNFPYAMKDGNIRTSVFNYKNMEAMNVVPIPTQWLMKDGKVALPETPKQITIGVLESAVYGGVPGNTWSCRTISGKNLHLDYAELTDTYAKVISFLDANRRIYAGSKSLPCVTILSTWEDFAYNRDTEIRHQALNTMMYTLQRANIPFRYEYVNDFDPKTTDAKMVILSDCHAISKSDAGKIIEFVKGGGCLLATGASGDYNENVLRYAENLFDGLPKDRYSRLAPAPEKTSSAALYPEVWGKHVTNYPKDWKKIVDGVRRFADPFMPYTTESDGGVFIEPRINADGRLFIHVLNFWDTEKRFRITLKQGMPVKVYDLGDNAVTIDGRTVSGRVKNYLVIDCGDFVPISSSAKAKRHFVDVPETLRMHAPKARFFRTNGGVRRLKATVGFDPAIYTLERKYQPDHVAATKMGFRVYADGRLVADTGLLRPGDGTRTIDADVGGASTIALESVDGGYWLGTPQLLALWQDVRFEGDDGVTVEEDLSGNETPQFGILTPPDGPEPRLNGAWTYGVRPGRPILHRIAATGKAPLAVSVVGTLPNGLAFDARRRLLTGTLKERGDHEITFAASNAYGVATRTLKIRVGDKLCLTPPMGWSAWNAWRCAISDRIVRDTAASFVTNGLADHGWTYINLDDGWQRGALGANPPAEGAGADPRRTGKPRNEDGTIRPNGYFPDMKALADHLHSFGLKFGVYSSPGPMTCARYEGSYGHEAQDAATWSSWGADYVKYDWCSYSAIFAKETEGRAPTDADRIKPFKRLYDELLRQPRDIVYSFSGGGGPSWGEANGSNLWRTWADLKDGWGCVLNAAMSTARQSRNSHPGFWADPDMLVVGRLHTGVLGEHDTLLTPNEQYSHISIWAILNAPLLLGCRMNALDEFTAKLLVNPEVIDVDQDVAEAPGSICVDTDELLVLSKTLCDGSKAVCAVNLRPFKRRVAVNFRDVGLDGEVQVRDLWRRKDLGTFANSFTTELPPHAPLFVRCRKRQGEMPSWSGKAMKAWSECVQCKVEEVTDEGVEVSITGNDSQLYVSCDPFVPKGNHCVYVRAKAAVSGTGSLFWMAEKSPRPTWLRRADFDIVGDGQWHTYRLRPFWTSDGRITGLRLDFPSSAAGTRTTVAEVRVAEEGEELAVDASCQTGVMFDIATTNVEYATFVWGGHSVTGFAMYGFATAADGRPHTYWFNLARLQSHTDRRAREWRGLIDRFYVRQMLKGQDLPVKNLRFISEKPDLPPDPAVTSARPMEAVPRAGRPLELEVVMRNYGTRPVRGLSFALDGLPPGVAAARPEELKPAGEIGGSPGFDTVCGSVGSPLSSERRFRITLSDPGAGEFTAGLTVSADGVRPFRTPVHVKVLPSLNLPKADYPPEPRPVDTAPYEVGAFLFPGWTLHKWHTIWSRAPWRKPLLGWYDETNPEVIDWQIKHLVENGISYVSVCWYWKKGVQSLNHWMTTFQKARYRRYLKWSLMWANHIPKDSHSEADQEKVTRFWIENYFCQPEYQRINDMPVVGIWCPGNMDRDLGPGGCRRLLEISRKVARDAGYKGIWFVAVRSPDGITGEDFIGKYREQGFDMTYCYRFMGYSDPDVPRQGCGLRKYADIAAASLPHWRALHKTGILPFLPSISTGFDNRPWVGERSAADGGISATADITVESFARICRDAKRFSDETGVRMLQVGPLDEWGEGSIGYPNSQHGFGMLEAVRDTFGRKPEGGWPVNYAPVDVGLGPYTAPYVAQP